jgi:hypothetical protein
MWVGLGLGFVAAVLGLRHMGQKKANEELVAAVSVVGVCLVGGYSADAATLAVAMHHLQREYDDAADELRWPLPCKQPLDDLVELLTDGSDDPARQALRDAAVSLRDEGAVAFLPEKTSAAQARIGQGLAGLWTAAAALGVPVNDLAPAPSKPAAHLTMKAVTAMPPLAPRAPQALELAVVGPDHQDRRQARYAVRDSTGGALVGHCSLAWSGESRCDALPESLAKPKTQLLGYPEPGALPLLFARGDDGKWAVHAFSGERLYIGYAGGAWTTDDYLATVTDDKGKQDRVVVVERHGGGPLTRRSVALRDVDPKAKRVGDATIMWGHLLMRTKRDDSLGSYFYAIPLPLEDDPRPQPLGRSGAVTFCRDADTVYVNAIDGMQAFANGAWRPTKTAPCMPAPGARGRRSWGVERFAGALWWKPANDKELLLVPGLVDGAFVAKSPLSAWDAHEPNALALTIDGKTRLIRVPRTGPPQAITMAR